MPYIIQGVLGSNFHPRMRKVPKVGTYGFHLAARRADLGILLLAATPLFFGWRSSLLLGLVSPPLLVFGDLDTSQMYPKLSSKYLPKANLRPKILPTYTSIRAVEVP
ncbi:hypothetical protein GQ53DRAFT_746601 [Thozetella sp. PMI_491]|nr:hypothetical protein GQ53DRAFT_746601 [Thozetella sp. PMI_491]